MLMATDEEEGRGRFGRRGGAPFGATGSGGAICFTVKGTGLAWGAGEPRLTPWTENKISGDSV